MLISYRWLQSPAALGKLEKQNVLGKMAKMQWWYVDVMTDDGSVLLMAFVPKKWWPDTVDADLDDALVFVSWLRRGDREARSITKTLDASRLRSCERGLRLEIPGGISIAKDSGDPVTYRFAFDLAEVRGWFELRSCARPFSAFPRGTLPGLGRAALLGGRLGAEAFSYVSQVPRGIARGELTLGSDRIVVDGNGYLEQGRFDDAPERLSKGWFWCHFLHPDWNIFGSPGVFLYVAERNGPPVFSGFNLFDRSLGLKNRTMAGEPPHPKVFTGGEMRFAYDGINLSIVADPTHNKKLMSFPSATTRQIFHTQVTDARLTVGRRGAVDEVAGQMILETCWLRR